MPATACLCRFLMTRIVNGKRHYVVLDYRPDCWWHGKIKQ